VGYQESRERHSAFHFGKLSADTVDRHITEAAHVLCFLFHDLICDAPNTLQRLICIKMNICLQWNLLWFCIDAGEPMGTSTLICSGCRVGPRLRGPPACLLGDSCPRLLVGGSFALHHLSSETSPQAKTKQDSKIFSGDPRLTHSLRPDKPRASSGNSILSLNLGPIMLPLRTLGPQGAFPPWPAEETLHKLVPCLTPGRHSLPVLLVLLRLSFLQNSLILFPFSYCI
jgi:hypothetical protein